MKPNSFKHFYLFISILIITALACYGGGSPPAIEPIAPEPITNQPTTQADSLSSANRAKLISATVQILGLFNENGSLVPGYVGSGTIISPSGLILTNAHVASPAAQGEPEHEPDALGISIIVQEDKPAVPSYIAKVLAVDGFLDLAVIQIIETVNGTPVDANSLNLPYVNLGNSDNVHVGDELNIFGFPAIGGNTITYTQGTISGFSSEDQLGDRAWIKTDATISGGNSGGLAADNNGNIIGVPTIAASSRDADISDCRVVQDTNGDGNIDNNDTCIPIGGFLNGIRPLNLAMPLIQAAQNGREYTSPFNQSGGGQITNPGSGSESASNFVWVDTSNTTSSSEQCNYGDADKIVDAYAEDTLCIATVFEYSGMTNGEQFVEYWYLDGKQIDQYSYAWEWDESGLFVTYLPNGGNPMPAGTYTLEVYAGDNQTLIGTSSKVQVSGEGGSFQTNPAPEDADTISVYGVVYDDATQKPINDAYVFVLTPGTTYDEWAAENYADKYVVTYLQTGNDGTYRITGIPRNTEFTLVFSAQGYYDSSLDNATASDNDPAEFELNVGLSQ
ncbi:MAG: 2-alkenal reductase [Chloroflexi bacterium OLB14]|nr:MAG: 2-alkenal reductase [Chloroflexi bacterium OLB14]